MREYIEVAIFIAIAYYLTKNMKQILAPARSLVFLVVVIATVIFYLNN